MFRLASILFVVTNLGGIFIGGLHLNAHYAELLTPLLSTSLDFDIPVTGTEANTYKLWQGFSFMMGACFVVLGLLNLVTSKTSVNGIPHPMTCIIMIAFSMMVCYSGYAYFEAFQLYGGMALVLINSFILFASLKH